MSTAFNPYRDWLGVDSPAAMPSYYELLGLRPLETDTGKIGAAFERQSQRLSPHLSGSEANAAQRLLGELAEARMTLLTPTAKRAYDQALASRYQTSPEASSPPEQSSVTYPDALLPPAASAPTGPSPTAMHVSPPSYQQPAPVYGGYTPAQGYQAAAGYNAGQNYPAAQQTYPAAQAYPGYPAWQPQMNAPTAAPLAAYPSGPYYAAPQAVATVAAAPPAAETMPDVRRRPVRRRSSAAPALAGVGVIVAAVLGGLWLYTQAGKTVAVVDPKQSEHVDNKEAVTRPAARDHDVPATKPPASRPSPPRIDAMPSKAPPDPVMAPRETMKPNVPKAVDQGASTPNKPEPDKPEPAKPEPVKPEPAKPTTPPLDKPTEPMEMKASPEETAAVSKILQSVRAALAGRDVARAQDLLAEATIEATAPDTLAAVNRVEMLTNYVEMFWDAVRKTLPKVELEELQIDGKVMNVVEADENHIVVRVEGRNREYRWQQLPNKIAYHLADRWLTPDDPVRNLVLAAFEIAEPKGDRAHARTLLEAATAAQLNAQPLLDELAQARGK